MKRVLVTGATGFIGKPCIEALCDQGFEVHAVSSQSVSKQDLSNKAKKINWHQADLHDFASVKDLLARTSPSHLLHLAWYVEHGAYWTSDENLKWVKSSINLIEEFIVHGGQRIVCTGTCAEYDWSEQSCAKPLSEQATLIQPHTLHGASKAGLYMILKALCELKGVSLAWGRLFFPYGPNELDKRLIPNAVSSMLSGQSFACKYPDLKRDFVFVDDIAKIMMMLLSNELVGPVNIASGKAVSLGNVVEAIAKILKVENPVQYGAAINASNEPAIIVGDTTRLKKELGFNQFTSLEKGLEQTINWWSKAYQYTK